MPARTTELESVNTMLSTIGEPPVNSLTGQQTADAAIAKNILDEVSRDVQTAGWHFNTQYGVTLSPSSDGTISIGSDIVRVDVDNRVNTATNQPTTLTSHDSRDIVQRGSKLFDRTNNTTTFTSSVKVTTVTLLEFEDLPEPARRYITIRSARIFQDRMVGSQKHNAFTLRDEMGAMAVLREFEGDTADHNIFNNYDTAIIVNRGNAIRGASF